jgi:hypothetical protein
MLVNPFSITECFVFAMKAVKRNNIWCTPLCTVHLSECLLYKRDLLVKDLDFSSHKQLDSVFK